ncbi:MAG: hypothetical protein FJW36_03645 [Acidobacteria bacterium]|nr:hypothetical protein [Acidobacteriota bacterium]
MVEQVDAKKRPIDGEGARAILGAASDVYVAKGKKVLHFSMKSASMEEVLAVALGPTGNLRAPTFRKGKTVVVGFEEGAYREVLG